MHISLLPDGRLLYWGRDKAADNYDVGGRSETYLVDPLYLDNTNYTESKTNTTTNLFCAGHSFLPDGRLLATGGHGKANDASKYPGADPSYSWVEGIGEKHINIFDYRTSSWTPTVGREMENGRWYPFHITMANGETVIMSGTFWDGTKTFGNPPRPDTTINADVSIRDLQGGIRTIHKDAESDAPRWYPYLSLTPDNKVFNAKPSPAWSFAGNTNRLFDPYAMNPRTGMPGLFTVVGRPTHDHWEGTSVMYESGKVLLTGGSYAGLGGPPSNLAETIDLTRSAPQWNRETQAGNMTWGRQYPTGTLLPDGKVLVTGGTNCAGSNNLNCGPNGTYGGAAQTPELWDPADPSRWQQMNATTSGVPRVYHSVAMLMPDARVLIGGGGLPAAAGEVANGVTCTGGGPQDPKIDCRKLSHSNVEFFSPPYLYDSNGNPAVRPAITSAPESIAYGQTFLVGVGNVSPSSIQRAVLVRLPSVTHTYGQDQRRVDLGPPLVTDGTRALLRAPSGGNVCPPGPYMLFLISNNERNTPSVAKIVRVGDIAINREWPNNGTSQSFTKEGKEQNARTPEENLTGTVSVSASSGLSWTATSNQAWVKIKSATIGAGQAPCTLTGNVTITCTGTRTVTYSVDPNLSGTNRLTSITFAVPGREAGSGLDFVVYQSIDFSDVPLTTPFYKFISTLYARGATGGCGGGNFCPEAVITRGQAAVFLSIMVVKPSVTIPNPPPGESGFTDIAEDSFYRRFITYAVRRKIASGCGGTNFCPDQGLTRRDAMVWLLRAIGVDNPPPISVEPFADVPLSDPAAPFIAEGVRRGFTAGCGNGNFCPDLAVNRAQISVFLTQAFGL